MIRKNFNTRIIRYIITTISILSIHTTRIDFTFQKPFLAIPLKSIYIIWTRKPILHYNLNILLRLL